jgi:hypothetical protein
MIENNRTKRISDRRTARVGAGRDDSAQRSQPISEQPYLRGLARAVDAIQRQEQA